MIDRMLQIGAPDIDVEKRYRRKDGTVIWVRVSTARPPAAGQRPSRNTDDHRGYHRAQARGRFHCRKLATHSCGLRALDDHGRAIGVDRP